MISPINYMGNKSRLIKKGLIEKFPKDINKFYDLFAGSCVVSLNTDAKKYIINDLDYNVYNIYKFFYNIQEDYNELNLKILNNINKYNLPLFSTDTRKKGMTDEIRNFYKPHFFKLRDDYNDTKDIYKLLTLQYYSMSRTMRFNSKGDFNMPFGKDYYIEDKHKINFRDFINFFNKDVVMHNKSYDEINIEPEEDNFVYLDPPYQGTTATYNENNKWTQSDDFKLFEFCKKLDEKNIKFALSNTYINKGVENTCLKEFVKNNGFKEHFFDDFTYSSFGKGNAETVEVLITNY